MTTRQDSEERNAREEFEEVFKSGAILCAKLVFQITGEREEDVFLLRKGHTLGEYENFLSSIDRTYNPCYGPGVDLHGTVWMTNGNWYERADAAERGVFFWVGWSAPDIPEECENATATKSSGKR